MSPREADDRPVFAAPWQAQAFALTVHLAEHGVFGWDEWTEALAARRRLAPPGADGGSEYYLSWLDALEALLAAKGCAETAALAELKAAWAEAYRRTPHGRPVRLAHAAGSTS